MFKISLGFIIGLFVSMIGFSLLSIFDIKIDLAVITNIIIGVATAIATAIHWDYRKSQHKERVWDSNKGALIKLSTSLAKVMECIKIQIESLERYCELQEYEGCLVDVQEPDINKIHLPESAHTDLNEALFVVKEVYEPILGNDLKSAIDDLLRHRHNIAAAANEGEIDEYQELDYSFEAHLKLQIKLKRFITEISGIRDF